MPQMAPLPWIIIFLTTLLSLLVYIALFYFLHPQWASGTPGGGKNSLSMFYNWLW